MDFLQDSLPTGAGRVIQLSSKGGRSINPLESMSPTAAAAAIQKQRKFIAELPGFIGALSLTAGKENHRGI